MTRSHLGVRMLCEGALFVAVALVLDLLPVWEMPWGGSISLCMAPFFVFACRWGLGPGLLAGFYPLDGIPGFFELDGRWTLAGRGGLLIPCRDRDGHIQGLQIRLDDADRAERKYRWLSSRGLKRGTRSHSWIHVTGDIHAAAVYLTEGPLKGDVSSYLDHDALFLCFAGVKALSGLQAALMGLERVNEAVIALDMDKLTNWRVRQSVERIRETLRSIPSIRIRTMDWNLSFNGVDDYYRARRDATAFWICAPISSPVTWRSAGGRHTHGRTEGLSTPASGRRQSSLSAHSNARRWRLNPPSLPPIRTWTPPWSVSTGWSLTGSGAGRPSGWPVKQPCGSIRTGRGPCLRRYKHAAAPPAGGRRGGAHTTRRYCYDTGQQAHPL